jgi:hypothetical protein
MHPIKECCHHLTRRHFFGINALGIGTAALATLLDADLLAENNNGGPRSSTLQAEGETGNLFVPVRRPHRK